MSDSKKVISSESYISEIIRLNAQLNATQVLVTDAYKEGFEEAFKLHNSLSENPKDLKWLWIQSVIRETYMKSKVLNSLYEMASRAIPIIKIVNDTEIRSKLC